MRSFGKGLLVTVISAAAGFLGLGCGAPPPCSSSALCPEGTVCGAMGACAPLDLAAGRFTQALWVVAQDWGHIGGPHSAEDTDLLPIGGNEGQIAYLTFGPLPHEGQIKEATLVLWPHTTWDPPSAPARLAAYQVHPFDGSSLNRRNAPRRARLPVGEAGIASGSTRLLRFDVTELVKEAQKKGTLEVSLAIVSRGDEVVPLRFASPHALALEERPRLELTVR